MAFNPFHGFRKHQKVVFAALTIICMLTFVLASGVGSAGGDFFSELTRWFGGKSVRSEVATLYGSKISPQQIALLRAQRKAANAYMVNAVIAAQNNLLGKVFETLSFNKERRESEIQGVRFAQQLAFQYQYAGDPRLRDWTRQQYLQKFEQYYSQLGQTQGAFSTANNTADADRARQLMANLSAVREQINWLLQFPKDDLYRREDLYFGGSTTGPGLLDFMIWQRQADQLGIHLTDEDIGKAILNETLGYLTREDDEKIRRSISRQGISDAATLRQVLGEEFRVRLAQAAVVGYDPGSMDMPPPVSPDELWEYYRKNRAEVSLKLLPIRVSKFVSAVKTKPTEEQLRKLYDQFKDQEYAPDKESPGFKQARQVKVEWIDISPDSKVYRTAAKNLLLSQIAASVSNPTAQAALGVAFLEQYKDATQFQFGRDWGHPEINGLNDRDFALALYIYKSLKRPETLASTIGLEAGGNAFGPVFSAPSRAVAREAKELSPVVEQEGRRRVSVASAFVGAGSAVPFGLAIANIWVAAGWDPQYVPPALMERDILKKIEVKLADILATSAEKAFKDELEKLSKETTKEKRKFETAAAEFVKQQLAKNKWEHGGTKTTRDVYDIGQDEGLKPLKDAYVANHIGTDPKAKFFGGQFFYDGQNEMKPFTPKTAMFGDKKFLFWTVEDNPAKVLPFDQVKKRVEEAWYLKEARPLAKVEAEKLEQAAKKSGEPVRVLVDAAKGEPLIELDAVARLTGAKSARADIPGTYQPYRVPDDKVEYTFTEAARRAEAGDDDFVNKVLDLKQVGDVAVVEDLPKKTFYVAAVTFRREPEMGEFRQGALLPRLQSERHRAYRLACLERLRAEAHLNINDDAMKQVEEKGTPSEE